MGGSRGYTIIFRTGTGGSNGPLMLRNRGKRSRETSMTLGKTCNSRDHKQIYILYPRDPTLLPCT